MRIKAVDTMAEKQGQEDHKLKDLQRVQILDLEEAFVEEDTPKNEGVVQHLSFEKKGPEQDKFEFECFAFKDDVNEVEL